MSDAPQQQSGVAQHAPREGEPAQTSQQQAYESGPTAEMSAALERMEDRYKRALADLDNFRKRAAREADQRVSESRDAILTQWLEAVDSVERALRTDTEGPLLEGLRSVLSQMEAILARYGVKRIGAAGEPFDPTRHDAIGVRETDDVPDRTVVEVARSGFAAGDRVLRPAQVIVSRRPERQG